MKMLSWVAERPMVAGSIRSSMRLSPLSRGAKTKWKRKPVLPRVGTWIRSWSAPPNSVAQAMPTMAGRPKRGSSQASVRPPTMEPRLKKLDDSAGTKNLPLVFSMPMTTAESDTKSRKGSMMRVSVAVSSVLPATN